MVIVSTRDFRTNQTKYLNLAKAGEHVVLKSRAGNFRIYPENSNEGAIQAPRDLMVELKNALLSANSGVKLVDFENPDNNEWHVTTEFTCHNDETDDEFRPDITCFVNGMPLAFIEVKKPNNHEGILAERDRINMRMSKKCFRTFFNITQLMIFSNNQEYDNTNRVPIQGAFYCCSSLSKAFFNVFREEDKSFVAQYPYLPLSLDIENKVLKHRNCVVLKNLNEYQTNKQPTTPTNRIITSMLSKERFLFLLRYGFAYVERKVELEDDTMRLRLIFNCAMLSGYFHFGNNHVFY
jgi:type I restriction enzyme, R subunit